MATIETFSRDVIRKNHPGLSPYKAMIETAFYGNRVQSVKTLAEAYTFACLAPGTIVTDLPIKDPRKFGLPPEAKLLVFNDGQVVGRTAAARVIADEAEDPAVLKGILREALFMGQAQSFYKGEVLIGLEETFMVKAHLMIPEDFAGNFYAFLLNFQLLTEEWEVRYQASKDYPENDLYLYADPNWRHPDFPHGLVLLDPAHNVAAILGLRYFGELKKAALSLAWGTAHRHGFIACHGGMKQFCLPDHAFTMAAFGLSGSGKSTITLADHGKALPTKVLHDDAFVIRKSTSETIALEPSYFDKTQDYHLTHEATPYFMTCHNVGVTLDHDGKKVIVPEDIRNANGRTVKQRAAIKNRVDHLSEKLDAVCWIMKDDSLPPIVRVEDPGLAALFGLTLMTKRSTAEHIVQANQNAGLVIEPFANPFRCYPLSEDYADFHELFAQHDTACYLLNTGYFLEKKVLPSVTLASLEAVAKGTGQFAELIPKSGLLYLMNEGYEVFLTPAYLAILKQRMAMRLTFLHQQQAQAKNHDLFETAIQALNRLILKL